MPRRPLMDRADVALVLAILVSFFLVARLPFAPAKLGDLDYHRDAQAMAAAIRGAGSWSDVHIHRAPAPVFYYAIPYLLVPPGSGDQAFWRAGVTWSASWVAVALLLVRRTGVNVGGRRAGILSAILVLLSPFAVYYAFGILAEPPAFLGAALFLFGWSQWKKGVGRAWGSSSWWVCWLGLALLISSRPNAGLILPLAILMGLLFWKEGSPDGRRRAAFTLTGVGLVLASAVLSAMAVRGLGGGWQKGMLGLIVFQGRFQYRNEPWDWREWRKDERQGSRDYADEQRELANLEQQAANEGIALSAAQWRWIRKDILEHPWLTLRMTLIRAATLNLARVTSKSPEDFRAGPLSGEVAYGAFHTLVNCLNLLILAGAIAFLASTPGSWKQYWVLWGPWFCLFVFASLTFASHRYLFPGRPGLAVLGAMFAVRLMERSRVSRALPAGSGLTRIPGRP